MDSPDHGIAYGGEGRADSEIDRQRAQRRRRRQQKIRLIGVSLMGFVLLGILAAWLTPVAISMAASRHRTRLINLPYPGTPVDQGNYPVTMGISLDRLRTLINTPPMPLEAGSASKGEPITLLVRDGFDGPERTEPSEFVIFTVSRPWSATLGRDRLLTLTAEGRGGKIDRSFELQTESATVDYFVPTEFFVELANADGVSGTVDGMPFQLAPDEMLALRGVASRLRLGTTLTSSP